MRKSFDGLSGIVQTHFGQDPLSGHLFVFFSKRRDRMKILAWDIDGFVLYYKRLERGTYTWVGDLNLGSQSEILAADFSLVLAGINPVQVKRQKRFQYLPERAA
jgi:transposase